MPTLIKRFGFLVPMVLVANLAHAHTDGSTTMGFLTGLSHPLLGLDHILAMVAVGLWAALLGRRATWLVPGAFVGTMVIGALLAMSTIGMPAVEFGILGSVVVFGALIALNSRPSIVLSMGIVALFALFHGHAHGAEMPALASGLLYGLGFTVATALLHILGIGLGLLSDKVIPEQAIRASGVAMIGTGAILFALG